MYGYIGVCVCVCVCVPAGDYDSGVDYSGRPTGYDLSSKTKQFITKRVNCNFKHVINI